MGSVSLKRPRPGTRSLFFGIFSACFLGSLLVHLLFLGESRGWIVSGLSAANYDTIVPRTFRMKRVDIDPKTLVDAESLKEKKEPHVEVVIAQEHPKSDGKSTTEEQSRIMQRPKEILPDERGEQNFLEKGEKLPGKGAVATQGLPNTIPLPEMVLEPVNKLDQPTLLPRKVDGISGIGATAGQQAGGGVGTNFSNIDDLLAGAASLSQETAPILMPTDLLFEYDSDTLRKEASQSLLKLGALIRRNGQAAFRIEGHTDSFGSDSYNEQLSLRRAEAVKKWLIQNAGLNTWQITTAGLGKRHLLAPATGGVAEQQLNRRVEIVITTH